MAGRTTIDQLRKTLSKRIRRLTPQQALSAQEGGAVLIDVRDSAAVAAGTPAGAIQIHLSVLPWRADPTAEQPHPALSDLATPVIVMCQEGYASVLAVALLERIGRTEVADVVGGFSAWQASGLPTVETYGTVSTGGA